MNSIQNYDRFSMNLELPNPENFMGTLGPRKFKSDIKRLVIRVNAFREEFERICIIVCFSYSLHYISITNAVRNSQNNINSVKIMPRIH